MQKFTALDVEDLAVISAHMQDSILSVGSMRYDRKHRKFAVVASRFAWEEPGKPKRRHSGLHFGRVLGVKTLNMLNLPRNEPLCLLSVTFAETDSPAGEVTLSFSGGSAVRLKVECLECQMADLGPSWDARIRPQHPLAQDDAD
jgi:hypothetical protein